MLTVHTDSELVNAVLYHKAARARELCVELNVNLPGISSLPLDDKDMCSLLTNLLDNAIEAAKDSPGRKIVDITDASEMGQYALIVKNPYVPKEGQAAVGVAGQENKKQGFGLKIIHFIVQKYNGSYRTAMENGIFTGIVLFAQKM